MSHRYSRISHQNRRMAAPIGSGELERLVGLLASRLRSGANLLDIGCGKAELLLRLLQAKPGCQGLGIDTSQGALEEARIRRDSLGLVAEFQHGPAEELPLHPGHFQMALCIGSSHTLGGLVPALSRLSEAVASGGLVVMGDLFWQRLPTREDLETMSMTLEDLPLSLESLVQAGKNHRLEPIYVCVSSQREWDEYEWDLVWAVDCHLRQHPDDPDASAFRQRMREMRDSYLGWRRHCMGFAITIFAKD